ncbi:MAG: zinc ABC transporter substrate-binding protein [Chlamydiales bacterium]|nr:zinc ABC transporter substrate-binding protein [Chlamydiales bacterium]
MMRIFFFLIAPFLLILGCSSPTERSGKPLVVVSIPPYINLIEELGDGVIEVDSVLSSTDDPHTFEPKPRQMDSFQNARLFIGIGEPFEAGIIQALRRTSPNLQVLNLTQITPPSGGDRHLWMSPVLVETQVAAIATSIKTIVSGDDQGKIDTNLAELQSELQSLDQAIQKQLRPFTSQAILVSHPSFGYFCDQYNLVQIPVESEGKDPLPRQLEAILQLKQSKIFRCAFVVPQGAGKGTRQIAKRLEIPVYDFNPLAEDYFSNMKKLSDLIAQGS